MNAIEIQPFCQQLASVYKSSGGYNACFAFNLQQLDEWPIPFQVETLESDYGKTFCLRCGDVSKPALILLHGLAVNCTSFKSLVPYLAKHYALYLIDFPNNAGFSIPTVNNLEECDIAKWLDVTIEQLGVSEAHVLGVSFGAWLALQAASEAPSWLKSLTLIAPPAISGKARLSLLQLIQMIYYGLFLNRRNAKKLTHMFAAQNYHVPIEITEAIYLGLKHTKLYKSSGHRFTNSQLSNMTSSIQVIVGEDEILSDPNSIQTILPSSQIHEIHDAGHLVHIEKPQDVARLVDKFIKKQTQHSAS